ncbi:hypothetical protein E2C01_059829 [Portunus trituberculatus]|uniref:Uncharacterized protein n=1 Tax=Portunus trituberculatus TaxID=210409 RepID=A0A5B7H6G0_PORTR|nr:hypothetical protein [Portunus trituberculatus]
MLEVATRNTLEAASGEGTVQRRSRGRTEAIGGGSGITVNAAGATRADVKQERRAAALSTTTAGRELTPLSLSCVSSGRTQTTTTTSALPLLQPPLPPKYNTPFARDNST